jgi:hypothetical protein
MSTSHTYFLLQLIRTESKRYHTVEVVPETLNLVCWWVQTFQRSVVKVMEVRSFETSVTIYPSKKNLLARTLASSKSTTLLPSLS